MYFPLGDIPSWSSRQQLDEWEFLTNIPKYTMYNCDCTEHFCQRPFS